MKYAILIPDGAADDPLPELDNRTPLEAANTPNMDEVARLGVLGTARTVPDGFESGSDVATMSLLGYDPAKYHTGRAPLEAAAQKIPLAPTDWVFRCNLVTVIDGIMKDHSAGGISDADARTMIHDLERAVQVPGLEFHTGVSYRNLLVYRGSENFELATRPPHEILDEMVSRHLPKGIGSDMLQSIMQHSQRVFAGHDVNRVRTATGHNPATQVWLWGQGHPPAIPKFADRFGVNHGAMITGVDLLRGLAVLLGWDVVEVPGMTSFHDTDYAGQGRATCAALDRFDIVVSHIESPDEASHQADWKTKVAAIEAIDEHVVGPVLDKLRSGDQWRLLVLPDHPTNIATRRHGYAPTLFAMCGIGLAPGGSTAYSEAQAVRGQTISEGHELMAAFLGK
ncbi:MAG: cofactor-independent phosphoglycerate mutase [Burkholderiales bacterium]|nr:cofactor-independent phosphoglycerate mutase [Phycisphaerae bacterium]